MTSGGADLGAAEAVVGASGRPSGIADVADRLGGPGGDLHGREDHGRVHQSERTVCPNDFFLWGLDSIRFSNTYRPPREG
jgi:hypothetical protein